jgi:hypothetical protein
VSVALEPVITPIIFQGVFNISNFTLPLLDDGVVPVDYGDPMVVGILVVAGALGLVLAAGIWFICTYPLLNKPKSS